MLDNAVGGTSALGDEAGDAEEAPVAPVSCDEVKVFCVFLTTGLAPKKLLISRLPFVAPAAWPLLPLGRAISEVTPTDR